MSKVDGLEDFFNGVSEPSAELADDDQPAPRRTASGSRRTQVADAVSGALLGVPAGEVRLDDRSIAVRVRAPDSVRFDPQLLGALPIVSPQTQRAGAARRARDVRARRRRAPSCCARTSSR